MKSFWTVSLFTEFAQQESISFLTACYCVRKAYVFLFVELDRVLLALLLANLGLEIKDTVTDK